MRFRHSSQRVFGTEQLDPRLRHGLVGWWPGDGSGLTLRDRSGYGSDGSLVDGPTWSLGVEGRQHALAFDGTDDYVEVGNPAALQIAGDLTVAFWARPAATQNSYANIVRKFIGGPGGFALEQNGSTTNQYYFAWVNGGAYGLSTYVNMVAEKWQHVAFVLRGATLTHFVNGAQTAQVTEAAGNAANTVEPFRIGYWNAGSRYWTGTLADLRVYARALAPGEVQLLAQPTGGVLPAGRRRVPTGATSVTVDMDALASGLVFGEPDVLLGAITRQLDALPSSLAFGAPTVTLGGLSVDMAALPSGLVFGEPDVTIVPPVYIARPGLRLEGVEPTLQMVGVRPSIRISVRES